MRTIRFIQIGPGSSSLMHNLTVSLTRIQDAFDFNFDDDVLSPDADAALAGGVYSSNYLEQLAGTHMSAKGYGGEYPIVITSLPLEEQVVSSSDHRIAVLSIHGWSDFCCYPVLKGLQYLIAPILLDFHLTTESHYDTRGCPNDYCDKQTDINNGMSRSEFCETCRRTILWKQAPMSKPFLAL